MFCNNCSKEITDNSKFCQYCGAKVETENKDSGNGCLITAIICGIIFVITL